MNDIGHSGLCIICGKPIELAPVLYNCKIPGIFFCSECEKEVMNSRKDRSPMKEEKDEAGGNNPKIT